MGRGNKGTGTGGVGGGQRVGSMQSVDKDSDGKAIIRALRGERTVVRSATVGSVGLGSGAGVGGGLGGNVATYGNGYAGQMGVGGGGYAVGDGGYTGVQGKVPVWSQTVEMGAPPLRWKEGQGGNGYAPL